MWMSFISFSCPIAVPLRFAVRMQKYYQYFESNFPARVAYQVAVFPRGHDVEIEVVFNQGPLTTA